MSGKRPFLVRLIGALHRLRTDRNYRILLWLRLTRPRGIFQWVNTTGANRYPVIFRFVQAQLGADHAGNILSFGCSTGDEVFTLRRYFPQARIKGVDINAANIAVCRKRLRAAPDAKISFATANSTAGEPDAAYDAIFCMAVLRHGDLNRPGVTRCDHLIRFADFAAAIADFERCLKPGGLLILRHSNFRLADTPVAPHFETRLGVKLSPSAKTPLFGPDNQLLPGVTDLDTVFRKRPR